MTEPEPAKRWALVDCKTSDESRSVGTGYLIAEDLVLTASHVVPSGARAVRVRAEADGSWYTAETETIWRGDSTLDAALIRLEKKVPGISPAEWTEQPLRGEVEWQTVCYPQAARIRVGDTSHWKSVDLSGTLNSEGGGGQGPRKLDLTVKAPPRLDDWYGASGAPVVVDGRLAGLIAQVTPGFEGSRVWGVPASSLLENAGFRLAIAPPWLAPESLPKASVWVLVVLGEGVETELERWVDDTLEAGADGLRQIVGSSFEPTSVKVRIVEALASPAHWLAFVRTLCRAPIAVFDATGFEPAVMLALGVRSVVKRGLTLTSTAHDPSKQLSQLPFNIKETKLLHHGDAFDPSDDRHPQKAIAAALKKGWRELGSQPRYLDLPAYDGVRCAHPASSQEDIGALRRILMLCPFSETYEPTWRALSNALALRFGTARRPARMLDLLSPRLVGQALYEGIRWAQTCVIDWTGWRANVFFEFGARLACARIGPICLIRADESSNGAGLLHQQRRLLELWQPASYQSPSEENFAVKEANRRALAPAFTRHEQTVAGAAPALSLGAMPDDATYQVCRDAFQWPQEALTIEPHELLRRTVVDPFGPDPQAAGTQPILFAAGNPEFSRALELSIRERWIAAWYYLANRYPPEQWETDPVLREKILLLAEQVLQFGLREIDLTDPHLKALRDSLAEVSLRLKKSPEIRPAPGETAHSPSWPDFDVILKLKTAAKNQRDRGEPASYENALGSLETAIGYAGAALTETLVPDSRRELLQELADCWGMCGGIERRWGTEAAGAQKLFHLGKSCIAYDRGYVYEKDIFETSPATYNLVNRLTGRLMIRPDLLEIDEEADLGHGIRPLNVKAELNEALVLIGGIGRRNFWAEADWALLQMLTGRAEAPAAYATFFASSPQDFVFGSVLAGLRALRDAGVAPAAIGAAIAELTARRPAS